MRKRLVFISPFTPDAGGTGLEQRIFSFLKAYGQFMEIDLWFSPTKGEGDLHRARAAFDLCRSVHLFQPARIFGQTGTSAESFNQAISRADAVHVTKFHDIISKITHAHLFWDIDEIPPAGISDPVKSLHRFEQVFVSSETERAIAPDRLSVIANTGRRPARPRAQSHQRHKSGPPKLLFVGALGHAPNLEALLHFEKALLPRILQNLGDVEIIIAGRSAGSDAQRRIVQRLQQNPRLTFYFDLPDLAPLYGFATLVIAPIVSGGGTRVKIIEAMAHECPIITTPKGAEGLKVTSGQHLMIAPDDAEFIAAVTSLVQDRALRQKLAQNAYDFYVRNHAQVEINRQLYGQLYGHVGEKMTPPNPEHSDLGILVLGYNRPHHLQSVLESLRLQGHIGAVHVWIDGTQGRGEYQGKNDKTVEIAKRYDLRELRAHNSHLGIEKMMLDALKILTTQYGRLIVLEDDCFPLEGSIAAFEKDLTAIESRPDIYSVYGHHFGQEPSRSRDFSRFQGWGWAAHSHQIRALLPRLLEMFAMDEKTYLAHVAPLLTPRVRARIDRTPRRNDIKTIEQFFSWDSATALLTAINGQSHRRTKTPMIANTGITENIGHFNRDTAYFRAPPFNMILLNEAWARYDQTSPVCKGRAKSYGLNGLDLLIREALPEQPGFFIELGAFDGVSQSNSVLLEAAGWRGLLIEATPGAYAKCLRARPLAIVEHAACVGADFEADFGADHIEMTDVGLMSMTAQSRISGQERSDWIRRGEGFAGRASQKIDVPARTLSSILNQHEIAKIDVLLLDVEGAEIEVLKGLDFSRHAPDCIIAEDAHNDHVATFLAALGYERKQILQTREFTRDCLYARP